MRMYVCMINMQNVTICRLMYIYNNNNNHIIFKHMGSPPVKTVVM